MVSTKFIDRQYEISLLEKDWKELNNAFVVVYGRRRIGKTRLLEEFIQNKEGIRYFAEDTNKKIQIREFKTALAEKLNDAFLAGQVFEDWSSLFAYLAKTLNKEKKMFLWIDEFSYLIKNDSSLASALQKFIDQFLRESKIFFIVSGSLFGLMNEKVLAVSSPLYGRRTRDLLIKDIPPMFLPGFLQIDFEETLKTILTIGGVPEYLRVASRYKSYSEFLKNEFFRKDGYFYREVHFLLAQEFKEIKTYFSILNAIASGNTRPTEIANFTGLKAREIYPYLELLITYGFVRRETPFKGEKRNGVYILEDSFFDSWFNLIYKNREKIENNSYTFNPQETSNYLGKRFEKLILKVLPLFFPNLSSFGRWWHKDKEIDLMAVNEQTQEVLFGECKWQEKVDAKKVLEELKEKAKYVEWHRGERKEFYAIFAKSFKEKIKEKGVYLFDLKDLEKKLR